MKQRYGGTLIHAGRDVHGRLEVVDDGFFRSLHFGSEPKQSSMDINNPSRLALTYTRAMTAALLFGPEQPRRALVVGLGGGSLVKFLLSHFPECRLDVVELREQVVEVARDYFMLPEEDKRLRIFVEDAGPFVRNAAPGQSGYDLILVDAYGHSGMSPSVSGLSFFSALRHLLSAEGVLAINLWSGDSLSMEDTISDIGEAFDGRVFRLPVETKDNVVAIAPNAPLERKHRSALKERAITLERHLDVEYPAFLKSLRKNNRWRL